MQEDFFCMMVKRTSAIPSRGTLLSSFNEGTVFRTTTELNMYKQ